MQIKQAKAFTVMRCGDWRPLYRPAERSARAYDRRADPDRQSEDPAAARNRPFPSAAQSLA